MAVWDKNTLWGLLFLLAGAVGQTVIYPLTSTCAVRGSTVTLPCTFTPRKSFDDGGKEVPLKIVRVRWCKNHLLCHGSVPSVFDSNSANSDPRYQYLGDMKTNCTLQIRDVQQGDSATFRFRMEADHSKGHFTNTTGVTVRVEDSTKKRIISSSDDKKLSRGETVTLLCASVCTFHQLEVTWFKDGHTLSETGPSLHLCPLTAEDSGNYTCALKKNMEAVYQCPKVKMDKVTVIHVVVFSVHTLLIITVSSVILKRTCCLQVSSREPRHVEAQPPHVTEELRTNEEERGQAV
ncbi:sialic acid-binding Ig-like lectin 10 [Oreochromis aureus]|uniref:sialic acid-binding Ig-like lectin 10 n=1 Tax=Oreochromis aureus TaxID=47969 RepID=UPI0012BCF4DC|nr:sialic acid-binding Ig-like lectin 10 [Oreochromis aureus]